MWTRRIAKSITNSVWKVVSPVLSHRSTDAIWGHAGPILSALRGVPPVLLVRDADGLATYYLLVGREGQAVNDRVLEFVAEPLEITGEVTLHGDLRILRARPDDFVRRWGIYSARKNVGWGTKRKE